MGLMSFVSNTDAAEFRFIELEYLLWEGKYRSFNGMPVMRLPNIFLSYCEHVAETFPRFRAKILTLKCTLRRCSQHARTARQIPVSRYFKLENPGFGKQPAIHVIPILSQPAQRWQSECWRIYREKRIHII